MIGVIDIGNTLIHCCYTKGERIIQRKDFEETNEVEEFFLNIENIIVISNSEEKREKIKLVLKNKKVYNFPIEKIERDYSGRVGEDRIASAFYIKEKRLYPAIVLDAGTAITIDFINENGIFSGGSILPGINVYLKSYEKISSLNLKIDEFKINRNPGKNTKDCIYSGLYIYIRGIKDYIKNEKKSKKVFLTGGDADLFKEKGWKIDKNLVLKGGIYAFHKFFT